MSETVKTNGRIWIGDLEDPLKDPVVLDELVSVVAERTDVDEVAIHATFPGDGNATVTLYLTCAEAALLAAQVMRFSTEGS